MWIITRGSAAPKQITGISSSSQELMPAPGNWPRADFSSADLFPSADVLAGTLVSP
jgi:hypothetical protein